jgi:hypothetical protein
MFRNRLVGDEEYSWIVGCLLVNSINFRQMCLVGERRHTEVAGTGRELLSLRAGLLLQSRGKLAMPLAALYRRSLPMMRARRMWGERSAPAPSTFR